MPTKAETDHVWNQMQQGVRRMRPLVVEQQPERDMRFPKPAMVVQERCSRSSYLERTEKYWIERWIEIALAGGTSMEEIEEIQAMTNYERPVRTLEEERKARLEMLEQCRRMIDRWDEEDAEKKPQEEETMVTEHQKQTTSSVDGSVKRVDSAVSLDGGICEKVTDGEDSVSSIKKLFRETPSSEQQTIAWKKKKRWKASSEMKGSVEDNLGFDQKQNTRDFEKEEQREAEMNSYVCYMFDKMHMRGKKVKIKIKQKKCTQSKGQKYQAEKANSETAKLQRKNMSKSQRESLMKCWKRVRCQLLSIHQRFNKKWILKFIEKKKGRMKVEYGKKRIKDVHSLMNAQRATGYIMVKKKLATEKEVKRKSKHKKQWKHVKKRLPGNLIYSSWNSRLRSALFREYINVWCKRNHCEKSYLWSVKLLQLIEAVKWDWVLSLAVKTKKAKPRLKWLTLGMLLYFVTSRRYQMKWTRQKSRCKYMNMRISWKHIAALVEFIVKLLYTKSHHWNVCKRKQWENQVTGFISELIVVPRLREYVMVVKKHLFTGRKKAKFRKKCMGRKVMLVGVKKETCDEFFFGPLLSKAHGKEIIESRMRLKGSQVLVALLPGITRRARWKNNKKKIMESAWGLIDFIRNGYERKCTKLGNYSGSLRKTEKEKRRKISILLDILLTWEIHICIELDVLLSWGTQTTKRAQMGDEAKRYHVLDDVMAGKLNVARWKSEIKKVVTKEPYTQSKKRKHGELTLNLSKYYFGVSNRYTRMVKLLLRTYCQEEPEVLKIYDNGAEGEHVTEEMDTSWKKMMTEFDHHFWVFKNKCIREERKLDSKRHKNYCRGDCSEKILLQNSKKSATEIEMVLGCKIRNKGRMVKKLGAQPVQEMGEVKAQMLYEAILATGLSGKSSSGHAGNVLTGTTVQMGCKEKSYPTKLSVEAVPFLSVAD